MAVVLAATPALAAAAPGPQVTVAGAAALGAGTTIVGPISRAERLSFRVNLGLRDPAGAERYAADVATPGSPVHGKFLSDAEFQARFGPTRSDVAALTRWLRDRGLASEEIVGGQVLAVSGTSADVSRAFRTTVRRVRFDNRTAPAAVRPLTVPTQFARLVDGIAGLRPAPHFVTNSVKTLDLARFSTAHVNASLTAARAARPTAAALPNDPTCPQFFGQTRAEGPPPPYAVSGTSVLECSVFVDPATGEQFLQPGANYRKIRALASVDPRYRGGGATVGIVLWNNDTSAQRNADFAARLNSEVPFKPGQLTGIVNTNAFTGCQELSEEDKGEINLDIQAVHATAPDATIRYFGSNKCVIPDISLARAVGEATPVRVITNSWGFSNQDYDPSEPVARSIHTTLVKAATRGITVLASSGDTGDGTQLRQYFPELSPPAPYPARTPSYPATDPYITAVGGVGFGTRANGQVQFKQAWTPYYLKGNGVSNWRGFSFRDELSPNAIGTGGGTSRSFAAPTWQKTAGAAAAGRTIPDVANSADSYFLPFVVALTVGGQLQLGAFGGTSVASPLTAGQVANATVVQKRPYLGVINPSLYRLRGSTLVSDVVPTRNAVTYRTGPSELLLVGGEVPRESLRTAPGFDNATGVGIPSTGWLSLVGR